MVAPQNSHNVETHLSCVRHHKERLFLVKFFLHLHQVLQQLKIQKSDFDDSPYSVSIDIPVIITPVTMIAITIATIIHFLSQDREIKKKFYLKPHADPNMNLCIFTSPTNNVIIDAGFVTGKRGKEMHLEVNFEER